MDKQEISLEELERFAAEMARAVPDLDCPECCEQGWKYRYVEMSATLFREEWEWHCLARVIEGYRTRKQRDGS